MSKCEYCNGSKSLHYRTTEEYSHVEIDDISSTLDVYMSNTQGDYIESIKINYCPICGRNLNPCTEDSGE